MGKVLITKEKALAVNRGFSCFITNTSIAGGMGKCAKFEFDISDLKSLCYEVYFRRPS
jgi:hypothetical protein